MPSREDEKQRQHLPKLKSLARPILILMVLIIKIIHRVAVCVSKMYMHLVTVSETGFKRVDFSLDFKCFRVNRKYMQQSGLLNISC